MLSKLYEKSLKIQKPKTIFGKQREDVHINLTYKLLFDISVNL